jgi:hypothetical protein
VQIGTPTMGTKSLNPRPGSSPMRTLDVEDLVAWVYRDQRANVVSHNIGGSWRLGMGSNIGAAVRYAELGGMRVDGGGVGNGAIHDDALTIHLFAEEQGLHLLALYGRSGARPEVDPPRLHLEPKWKDGPRWTEGLGGRRVPVQGSYRMIYDPSRNPVACALIDPRTTEKSILQLEEARRADYGEWWWGLALVAWHFREEGLKAHTVGPMLPPQYPWENPAPVEVAQVAKFASQFLRRG